MVFVLDREKRPLMPCSEKRARLLLHRGRAVVHRLQPFTIRLKDRLVEVSSCQPIVLKVDPGSKTTGMALVREERVSPGCIHHALRLAEIQHRGAAVRERVRQRAAYRRRRRSTNLRYRAQRSHNRKRSRGWLAPSLQSRVGNILAWTRRQACWAPVTAICLEAVRFDTQAMQNPEVAGIEYQQGELFGYEVREYLLQKFDHSCAYCGGESGDRVLEVDHIVPKSRGGTSRVSNLAIACRSCNRLKASRTAAEFGHPEVQARARAPLRDAAAVNAIRWAIVGGLRDQGFVVTLWSGGRTKWNRTRLGLPKTHALDALCVGEICGVSGADVPVQAIQSMGRGQRCRTNVNAYGFPRGYRTRTKIVHGFATGDLVRAEVPSGKQSGVHVGRVGVRVSGCFRVGRADGIARRYCRLLQRADGYAYGSRESYAGQHNSAG
jgi:5-methylcytosine-specific restriction endonuclease McrA